MTRTLRSALLAALLAVAVLAAPIADADAARKPHKRQKSELRKGLNPMPLGCDTYSEGYLDEYGLPQTAEWTYCWNTARGVTRTR